MFYNTEIYIEEAKSIPGDKYDYSKVEYVNSKTKICVICHELDEFGEEHGEFWVRPHDHIKNKKSGCAKCANKIPYTTESFIRKAKLIHGDKYDYSEVVYINKRTKIHLKCKKCGNEFEQYPLSHLQGHGCRKCSSKENSLKYKRTKEQFIEEAKKIHGDKYDYSKVEYVNINTNVCIICPKHGEFLQRASSHLHGCGCKKCNNEKNRYTTQQFIEKVKLIFGNIYDLYKVDYKTTYDEVCIICQKHGEFWKKPIDIIQGHGCPLCNSSSLEREIRLFLNENNIFFEEQKKFIWLQNKQSYLKLDFYLPQYNIAIECQGEQHFKPIEYFGGENGFIKQIERDKNKFSLCNEHNIKILYYSNVINKEYELGEVINNKDKLLKIIYGQRS